MPVMPRCLLPAAGHVDRSLYTSVQVEPSETFLSFVNSAGEAGRGGAGGVGQGRGRHAPPAARRRAGRRRCAMPGAPPSGNCTGALGMLHSAASSEAATREVTASVRRILLVCSMRGAPPAGRPTPTPPHMPPLPSSDEATDVTFNLKDFKAMLSLCENLGTHIRLWFDSPGNPLVAEPCFAAGTHGQVGRTARACASVRVVRVADKWHPPSLGNEWRS